MFSIPQSQIKVPDRDVSWRLLRERRKSRRVDENNRVEEADGFEETAAEAE